MQQIQDFKLGGSEKQIGADDLRHALQENGGLADLWYIDDGDILCHLYWCRPVCKRSTQPMVKLEQSATHRRLKSLVICQTRMLPRQSGESVMLAFWPLSPRRPVEVTHLDLQWDPVSLLRTNFWPKQMSSVPCVNVCQDPQTEMSLLRERVGVSRNNHILRVQGHTSLQETRAAEIFNEVGQRSFGRLFPGFTEDSLEQATLRAGQSGIGFKRARDVAGSEHFGAPIAAKP